MLTYDGMLQLLQDFEDIYYNYSHRKVDLTIEKCTVLLLIIIELEKHGHTELQPKNNSSICLADLKKKLFFELENAKKYNQDNALLHINGSADRFQYSQVNFENDDTLVTLNKCPKGRYEQTLISYIDTCMGSLRATIFEGSLDSFKQSLKQLKQAFQLDIYKKSEMLTHLVHILHCIANEFKQTISKNNNKANIYIEEFCLVFNLLESAPQTRRFDFPSLVNEIIGPIKTCLNPPLDSNLTFKKSAALDLRGPSAACIWQGLTSIKQSALYEELKSLISKKILNALKQCKQLENPTDLLNNLKKIHNFYFKGKKDKPSLPENLVDEAVRTTIDELLKKFTLADEALFSENIQIISDLSHYRAEPQQTYDPI